MLNTIGIKAGSEYNKFLPIWKVVIENAIYCRSWSGKKGLYRILKDNPNGMISIDNQSYEVTFELIDESQTNLNNAID